MADVKIAVLNISTLVTDTEVQNWMRAAQIQVTRDFAPIWKRDAQLSFVPKGQTPDPDAWQLIFADNTNQAGAEGYHDRTATGQPTGIVGVGDAKTAGDSWTVDGDHELLELLVDPWIDDVVIYDNGDGTAILLPKEVCDACEADQYGYQIQVQGVDGTNVSILMSDFVFPAYFWQYPPAGAQFDFMKKITAPFQILSGGYMGQLPIKEDPNGWNQVTADQVSHRKANAAPMGSRRERRMSKAQWKPSTK